MNVIKGTVGEVTLETLYQLQERLRKVDPTFTIFYYGGNLIIRREGKGRPLKTSSINKIMDYVERMENGGRNNEFGNN